MCARFENHWKTLGIFKETCSERHFWASRCGFVVLAKCTTKLDSESNFRLLNAIFCTRPEREAQFRKSMLKKRLWCEHVCKVRSRLVHFYAVLYCFLGVASGVVGSSAGPRPLKTTLNTNEFKFGLNLGWGTWFLFSVPPPIGRLFFKVFDGAFFRSISYYSFLSKLLKNSFWWPWGLLGSFFGRFFAENPILAAVWAGFL